MDDAARKTIAKLRWRLCERGGSPRDVPSAGLAAMYLEQAAEMRRHGFRVAHGDMIAAARFHRAVHRAFAPCIP